MKTTIRLWLLTTLLAITSVIFGISCSKNDDDKNVPIIPIVTTFEVSTLTKNSAGSGGLITHNGLSPITEQGVCWSTSPNPTIANNKTTAISKNNEFIITITNLTPNTTYYLRAYVTNGVGTGYGNEIIFTTLEGSDEEIADPIMTYGTLTDIDGNTYKTVTISNTTWMAENLQVTRYNDGTIIPNVTDEVKWGVSYNALCDYGNNPSNSKTYGKLYNWFTVNSGKLCPKGWHVPTSEWHVLGYNLDYGAFKFYKNCFTPLPGGARSANGKFYGIDSYGVWWSAASASDSDAYCELVFMSDTSMIGISEKKNYGHSVRCVKD